MSSGSTSNVHLPILCKLILLPTPPCYEGSRKNLHRDPVLHLFVSEGVKYKCTQCDFELSFTSYLKQHVESVHEGVKYKCTHHYGFFCKSSSDDHLQKMTWDTDNKKKVSHQYGFFCAFSNCHLQKMNWGTDHN